MQEPDLETAGLKLDRYRQAALGVAALGLYLQAVEWLDLFPWNDVRRGNGQETMDIALGAGTLLLFTALWWRVRYAPLVTSLALAFWAWLQISTWWIPYFEGASPGWKGIYARWFADTLHILPKTQENLPPDLNHLTLHLLIAAALILSLRAVRPAK